MAKFKYIASDKEGHQLEGTIDSTSESRARKELAAQGLTVSKISEVVVTERKASAASKKRPKPVFGTGVKNENVTVFSCQLATLLKAGLPLLRSLEVIGRQEKNPYFKGILEDIADSVRTGNKFSDGLAQHPKVFDKLYINMARAGEAGGVLDTVLDRLATFQEKAMKTVNKVKSAMVYPLVIMTVAIAIVAILMIFVIPQFQKIFADMLDGAPMPALTQMIINISDFMRVNYIATIGIIVGVFVAFKLFFKTKVGIKTWDTMALKAPKIGDMVISTLRVNRSFPAFMMKRTSFLKDMPL
jgi:type IV pilus assembly protein PilC